MSLRSENIPPWRDPFDAGPIWRVARHPFIVLVALAVCGAVAWKYLHVATPLYVSDAVLRVQQPIPQVFGTVEPSHSPDENAVFLNAELSVLTSTAVLEQAVAEPQVRQTKTYTELSAAPDPIVALRKKLRGSVGRKDDLITLEFDSPRACDAAAVVNAVVDAYAARQTHQKDDAQQKALAILEGQRAEREAAMKATNDRMLKVLRQAGSPALDSREKLAELSALRVTLRGAEQDEALAKTQYDEAAAALRPDPALSAELERVNAAGSAPTRTDAEAAQLRLSISELETKRQNLVAVQNLLPSHPQVVAVDKQLGEARLQYATAAFRRLAQLKGRADQMRATLQEQEVVAQDLAQRAAEYAQDELELKRLDEKITGLDTRIAELKAGEGSSGVRIEVVERGRPAARPSKPDVPRTYAAAGGLGLLLGGCLALARDGAVQRRRLIAEISDSLARRSHARRPAREAYEAASAADDVLRITNEDLRNPDGRSKAPLARRSAASTAAAAPPWSDDLPPPPDKGPRGRRQSD